MVTKKEYENLKQKINYHMDRYYNQDEPEISDYEYDQLMISLKEIEAKRPEWITPDSPTQKIGGVAKREAGVKITHNVPMLSIEDVFDKQDVINWVEKVKGIHPDATFSVEQKIDGLSMSLRMNKADDNKLHLTLAETRGDGLIGEDVTTNALVIPDVLQVIDLDFDYLELRGEVYMSHENFEEYNKKQEELGKKLAANPRNLAAGSLRQLDASITKERGLRMFVFNVQDGPKEFISDHTKSLDTLEKLGVKTTYHKLCSTAEQVIDAIDEIGQMRGNLDYDIDGAVVKINQTMYRNDFPAGSKYSSGHIAYKYPPEEKVVTIDEVLVDVGRTGKLTFTAIFHDSKTGKPARLCGTNVSRATLHNQDYINQMEVGIGGEYKLYKSGEIIPKLNGCVKKPDEVYKAPCNCPVCQEPLVREEETADIRCVNPSCPSQVTRTIAYFASRDAMNIIGLGDTLVEGLVKEGYLKSYADIYSLKNYREELIEKGVIGKEKNTDKLLAEIEKSKENEPERFLTGLGIRNVGKTTARTILKYFESVEQLRTASLEQLCQIEDVGQTTATCIFEFFNSDHNYALVEKMINAGVNTKVSMKEDTSDKLAGMTIVVTGTLPNLGRKEIEELIVKNGGKATGSVSKKTSLLVAGEAAGSKLTKAMDLGIKVVSEEEFLELIK